MNRKMQKFITNINLNKAFTLAEVLITLGIIGVIAVLTIPVLMQTIQDVQFKTAWKKEYSVLNQAYVSKIQDNGITKNGDWGTPQAMKDVFKNYFSYIKECDGTQTFSSCWNNIGAYNKTTGALYPTLTWWTSSNYSAILLTDGTTFQFDAGGLACTTPSDAGGGECGRIMIDVNGPKNPNTWGRDIFWAYVYPDRLLPCGAPVRVKTSSADNCTNGTGLNCSYDYIQGN
jgi:prepilin-type N-terminal cleavage/methylation domain-containing protein